MINEAHLHLLLNHIPIVGLFISFLVLIVGFILKNQTIKRTALALVIFSSLASIPAFYSGENAEDVIENLPSTSETLLHNHEQSAKLFFKIMLITGGLALIVLVVDLTDKIWSKPLYLPLIIGMVFCIYLAKDAGTSGGEIRHPEISNSQKIIYFKTEQISKHNDD